ncbi:MAG: hypothetical protein MPJ25_15215, partial [Pirellulales bacterium]|nr:hypothetical protein [Pirellulales bacterium]
MNSNTELLKSQYNVYSQEKYKNFDNGNTRKLNNQTITEADLKKHTIGKHSLSYKIDLFSNIFGLDLDVKGQFLSENLRSRELVALLEIIIINLGKEPSIAFKSRFKGGIHCYYKLEKKYPFNLIGDNLRRIFKDYRAIEILPTCNKPLRFPLDHRNGGMIVDRDLNPIKPSQDNYTFLREKTAEATTYNFNELFGIPSLVTSFVFDGKTKKKQINNATR